MGIIQFLLSVGLKGVPLPDLLISRVCSWVLLLISCNYKRIPEVTQSYSRLRSYLFKEMLEPLLRATAHSLLMCGRGF